MNPTGQPFNPQLGGPPPGNAAREAVNIPSLLLLIFGGIGVLWALVSMLGSGANMAQLEDAMSDPNFPEQAKAALRMMAGPGAKLMNLFVIGILGLMTFGAWQMRNLKSYGLAMTACVLGMLPCSGCCCVTLPIGIWAMTILMKPEVKSAFS